jgi:hypothetical protein
MKILLVIGILTSSIIFAETIAVPRVTQDMLDSQDVTIEKFHKKVMAWQRKLPVAQRAYFAEVWNEYQQEYKQFLSNKNSSSADILLNYKELWQHLMDNWNSFYRDYINYQQFYQKFLAWKSHLTPQQYKKWYTIINDFLDTYENYEQDPVALAHQIAMKKQSNAISELM